MSRRKGRRVAAADLDNLWELRNYMQTSYNGISVPTDGQAIEYSDGKYVVPDHPVIPFIEGDGTGRDIWKASQTGV